MVWQSSRNWILHSVLELVFVPTIERVKGLSSENKWIYESVSFNSDTGKTNGPNIRNHRYSNNSDNY